MNSRFSYFWKQYKRYRPGLISLYLLGFFVLVSLAADLIANGQPLYARYRGRTFYPAFQTFFDKTYTDSTPNPKNGKFERLQFDITDWRQLPLDRVIWAPIAYSPNQDDLYNADYISPSANQQYKNCNAQLVPLPNAIRHRLGTNRIGEDAASGIVHGTGAALEVGIFSMIIAALAGIMLGMVSGFFGDHRLRVHRGGLVLAVPGLFLGVFYGFMVRYGILHDAFGNSFAQGLAQFLISMAITVCITWIFAWVGNFFGKKGFWSRRVLLPIDLFVSRIIEIFDSIPALVLIITVSALFINKNLALVVGIIGLLYAPQIARLTRAEFIRIRGLDYVQSATALGLGDFRIVLRHILPNALAPVLVALAFGVASAIIAESSLSFLGIGVPPGTVTWGAMLSEARGDFDAWWMVVFPGLAIFLMVAIFNLIGEGMRQAFDPKGRIGTIATAPEK